MTEEVERHLRLGVLELLVVEEQRVVRLLERDGRGIRQVLSFRGRSQ